VNLATAAGHVLLQAGDYSGAHDPLTAALDQSAQTARRQCVVILIDLATTELCSGNLPTACSHATQAVTLLHKAPYALGAARLRAFRATAQQLLNKTVPSVPSTNTSLTSPLDETWGYGVFRSGGRSSLRWVSRSPSVPAHPGLCPRRSTRAVAAASSRAITQAGDVRVERDIPVGPRHARVAEPPEVDQWRELLHRPRTYLAFSVSSRSRVAFPVRT
jgi:hypothetical protein